MESVIGQRLAAALGDEGVATDFQRLSGGANMETWAFKWSSGDRTQPLILRRRPGSGIDHSFLPKALPLDAEAQLLMLAQQEGVAVPTVLASLQPEDGLGEGVIMTLLEGEALPQRIMREDRFAKARERFAFQCGEALARIHSVDRGSLPGGLRDLSWSDDLERLQSLCDQFGNPSPVHQLALNWLKRQPEPQSRRVLCHGDFRMGNLLLSESALAAVLDWELAHVGHAGEDLGYVCAAVWRFGGPEPVGGLGTYRQLLDGYQSVNGVVVDLEEVILWELYAALGWGIVCLTMLELHESGVDPGLERAAVGRRLSESEIDILLLLERLSQ